MPAIYIIRAISDDKQFRCCRRSSVHTHIAAVAQRQRPLGLRLMLLMQSVVFVVQGVFGGGRQRVKGEGSQL